MNVLIIEDVLLLPAQAFPRCALLGPSRIDSMAHRENALGYGGRPETEYQIRNLNDALSGWCEVSEIRGSVSV